MPQFDHFSLFLIFVFPWLFRRITAVYQKNPQSPVKFGRGLFEGPPLKVAVGVPVRPLSWWSFVYARVVCAEQKNNSEN